MANNPQPSGHVVTPDDTNYDEACTVWNSIYAASPAEIVYCQNAQEVASALKDVLGKGAPFRVRCGGHSYESWSTLDGGVVIDVTGMNSVEVDTTQNTAKIGAGCRLKDVYQQLSDKGFAIPGGTCPPVGISGLTLGGGLGMLVREHGLLIDSLQELEIVDAKGDALIASKDGNADLFWACRGGGGGNFGIATSFTFRVVPVKGTYTVFTVTWPWGDFNDVFSAWFGWAHEADRRLSMLLVPLPPAAFPDNSGQVVVLGQFVGTREELNRYLNIMNTGTPTLCTTEYTTYMDAVNQVAKLEGPQATVATTRVKGKSCFISDKLSPEAIQTFKDWMDSAPKGAAPTIYAMGGAISDVGPGETAFPYRDEHYLVVYQTNWDDASDDATNTDWCEGIYKAMLPYVKAGAYVNIPDRNLNNYLNAYYGDNLAKLVEVKRTYDADNVFNFEQSIPVSLPDDTTG